MDRCRNILQRGQGDHTESGRIRRGERGTGARGRALAASAERYDGDDGLCPGCRAQRRFGGCSPRHVRSPRGRQRRSTRPREHRHGREAFSGDVAGRSGQASITGLSTHRAEHTWIPEGFPVLRPRGAPADSSRRASSWSGLCGLLPRLQSSHEVADPAMLAPGLVGDRSEQIPPRRVRRSDTSRAGT